MNDGRTWTERVNGAGNDRRPDHPSSATQPGGRRSPAAIEDRSQEVAAAVRLRRHQRDATRPPSRRPPRSSRASAHEDDTPRVRRGQRDRCGRPANATLDAVDRGVPREITAADDIPTDQRRRTSGSDQVRLLAADCRPAWCAPDGGAEADRHVRARVVLDGVRPGRRTASWRDVIEEQATERLARRAARAQRRTTLGPCWT